MFMSKPIDVVNFRVRIKTALVKSFGGRCQLCGQEYPQSVFEFHHLNPAEKSFGLGNASTTRAKVAYAEEAKKCVMLCANCHRLVEHEDVDDSNLKCIFDEDLYYATLEKLANKNKKIQEEKKKEERPKPTKEELIQDLKDFEGNFSAIGRKYNYSANAVVKWCKKFNMPYHASDYKPKKEVKISKLTHPMRVAQLNKDTEEIIHIFESVTEAENATGNSRHISSVCNGNRVTAAGYKWKWIE